MVGELVLEVEEGVVVGLVVGVVKIVVTRVVALGGRGSDRSGQRRGRGNGLGRGISMEQNDSLVENEGPVETTSLPLRGNGKVCVHFALPNATRGISLGGKGAGRTPLNWGTRVGISFGATHRITYLHAQGTSVSHGNIKSSNILLTISYEARVSDFGYVQLVGPSSTPNSIADRLDLPRWVQSVLREEWITEVFDIELLRYQTIEEHMVQLLQLAVDCTAQYLDRRHSMAEVTNRFEELYHIDFGGDITDNAEVQNE
ncbi:putative pentatricopeptide repeat-containing protein-like [Capsicum annuum]|nr:putative pentatricopeptide repeat-containing protein-like [Capsicum annuum]